MAESEKPQLSIPEISFSQVSKLQKIRNIIREKDIILEPETSGIAEVSPNISRVWATLFGYDGSQLVRVRVDNEGRLSITDSVNVRSNYERVSGNIAAPNVETLLTFSQVCYRVQLYCIKNVLEVRFGVTPGVYYARVIATPFTTNAVPNTTGSILTFNGPVKYVLVGTPFLTVNDSVVGIGYYE